MVVLSQPSDDWQIELNIISRASLNLRCFSYDDSFPDNVPVSVVNADGDGSVVFKSASGCGKFNQNRPIVEKSFSKVNHNGLLTDEGVISYVDKIVFTM